MDRRSFLARLLGYFVSGELLSACRGTTELGPPVTTACVVANRSIYGQNTPSDGILTLITYRSRHVAARDITSLQLVYFNAAGSTDAGLNSVNYKAGIEYPAGLTVTPVNFGGVRTVAVPASTKVTSDATAVVIPKGAVFYVRTSLSVAPGGKWIATGQMDSTNWAEGCTNSVDSVDTAGTMGIMSDGSYMVAPIAITSQAGDVPGVVIFGDSIAAGTGEVNTFNRGYLMRALNGGLNTGRVPFSNVAYPGESINIFIGGTQGALRKALPSSVTFRDAIVAFGTNDISAGRTAIQVEADLTTLYNTLLGQGCRIWGVTLPPRTTSTDAWATTVNQTPAAGFAVGGVREAVNAWLRTLPAPLTGIIDLADVVESFRNSGLWKAPGWTADGTHPTALAHAAVAGVVPASLLSIASLMAQVVG